MKKQDRKEKNSSLREKILKRKYISIFLALFTLGVNIFAWFAFSSNASLQLDGTVASWDVEFYDSNGESTHNAVIEVTKMKPGMSDFTKTIYVDNKSDVDADFRYEVTSFSILGNTVTVPAGQDPIQYLSNFYPFSVQLSSSKNILLQNDSLTFDIAVTWPYESATPRYFNMDNIYQYDDSFVYYKLNNSTYSEYNVQNSTIFNSERSSLYLEKDDADTYFGMKCNDYESTTNKACLVVNMKLSVIQRQEG